MESTSCQVLSKSVTSGKTSVSISCYVQSCAGRARAHAPSYIEMLFMLKRS